MILRSQSAVSRILPILRRAGTATAACGVVLLFLGCATKKAPQAEPVPVTVATIERHAMPVEWHGIGTVEPVQTVAVRARVGGELLRVHFKEGDDVRQGQALFTLDARPAQAALEQAQAQLARDQALARTAEGESQRYAELVKKDYVTRSQYDSIQANAEALKQAVAADRAALENARLQVSYCSITAPVAGRVGSVLIQLGSQVKANDDKPLAVLNQIEPIRVTFALPQQYLAELRRRSEAGDLKAAATVPEETPAQPHLGVLTFIDNAIDRTTGTIQVKATFPNQDRALWPGQFVNVSLTLSTEENAVVAPAQAVQTGQTGEYVFVVKPDSTVELRTVKVGRLQGSQAVIAQGLESGETVVTEGQLRLLPGAKVQVKSGSAPAGAAQGAPS